MDLHDSAPRLHSVGLRCTRALRCISCGSCGLQVHLHGTRTVEAPSLSLPNISTISLCLLSSLQQLCHVNGTKFSSSSLVVPSFKLHTQEFSWTPAETPQGETSETGICVCAPILCSTRSVKTTEMLFKLLIESLRFSNNFRNRTWNKRLGCELLRKGSWLDNGYPDSTCAACAEVKERTLNPASRTSTSRKRIVCFNYAKTDEPKMPWLGLIFFLSGEGGERQRSSNSFWISLRLLAVQK